jgi:PAS domain S-box-containing protein
MNEKNKTSLRYKRAIPYIPVALTIFVGVMLSVVTFAVALRWEEHAIRDDFKHHRKEQISALKRGIDSNLLIVESLGGLYKASHKVERQEFREFVKPFLLSYPGIQALEWIPRVPDSQRAVYEEGARQDGFPDFQITERQAQGNMVRAAQHEEYFPVYFVEPYEGNELALGFDLASNPTPLEALNRSRETGEMVATARITLVQETGSQFGFLVFLPVYQRGSPTDSIDQRRENLEGFVLGVFRIGDIVEKALTYLESEGIDIYLYDQSAPVAKRLLYFHSSRTQKRPAAASGDMEIDLRSGPYHAETLDVGGRKWSILSVPTSEFIAASKTWQPWGALSFGLLLTGLLAAYFLVSIGRTAELAKINEKLQHEITERKRTEEALLKRTHDLGERVKELNCLYGISKLVEKPGISLEEIPQGVVDLIRPSWRYPEITCARVILDGQMFTTKNFKETIWKQSSDITVDGDRVGTLEVYYRQERPQMDEGPFLKEERNLIDAISERLGKVIERKRVGEALSEECSLLRTLIDNVPDLIYVKDTDSRYVVSNNAFARRVGATTPEEMIGKTVFDLFPKELAEQYCADDQELIRLGQPMLNREEQSVDETGNRLWSLTSEVPLRDSSGKIVGLVGIARDITKRKKMEEDRARLIKQLQKRYSCPFEGQDIPTLFYHYGSGERNRPGAFGLR